MGIFIIASIQIILIANISSSNLLTGVIQGQFKVSPPIKGLINDLKGASGFQIRMGDKLADFKFSLKKAHLLRLIVH